jgi:hypothetical protein
VRLEAVNADNLYSASNPQLENILASGGHLIRASVQRGQRGNNPAPPDVHIPGLKNTLRGCRDLCIYDRSHWRRLDRPQAVHFVADGLLPGL